MRFKVFPMADSEPGREVARSELRASYEDRDRVVELLRVSAGDGRLTADELDERLELAMTARTYGELAKLVADLPASGSVVSAPAPRASREPATAAAMASLRRANTVALVPPAQWVLGCACRRLSRTTMQPSPDVRLLTIKCRWRHLGRMGKCWGPR